MKKPVSIEAAIFALMTEFPEFKIDSISEGLPYGIAEDFAYYLLDLQKFQKNAELKRAGFFIEELHINGSKETQELATIGFLEAIQNVWENSDIDPMIFYDFLGPESKKWWRQLIKFWQKQIKYVGETLDTET